MTTILPIVWILVGLVCARFVGGYAAWNSASGAQTELDGQDIGWGLFCGFCTIFAWPIAVPWAVVHSLIENEWQPSAVFWMPPDRKRAKREIDRKAARREIARIEREHGIGKDDE